MTELHKMQDFSAPRAKTRHVAQHPLHELARSKKKHFISLHSILHFLKTCQHMETENDCRELLSLVFLSHLENGNASFVARP